MILSNPFQDASQRNQYDARVGFDKQCIFWISAFQSVSQLAKLQMLLFCHSGLDPWFDRLTTLSKVEGESSAVSRCYVSGCPCIGMRDRLLKSGMTGRILSFFEL
jgi:hypothetical protein